MVDETQLALAFPAAIVATWIAIAVVLRGKAVAREEQETGNAGSSYRFVFLCVVAGACLYIFGDATPFLNFLSSILVGMLIGGGTAYWLVRWLTSRPQERQQ